MADQIIIRDLLLRAIIGVNPDERDHRQDVILNIALDVDTRAAGRSDRLEDTVNYSEVVRQVSEMVESSSYLLIERLAEEVAAVCLRDARVRAVIVRLEKPRALRLGRSVAVEIARGRD